MNYRQSLVVGLWLALWAPWLLPLMQRKEVMRNRPQRSSSDTTQPLAHKARGSLQVIVGGKDEGS